YVLPTAIKVGGAWQGLPWLTAAMDAGIGLAQQGPTFAAGVEISGWTSKAASPPARREPGSSLSAAGFPRAAIALRAGYKWRGQDVGFRGHDGLTAGIGFRIGRLGLDYAYQPFGDLATSHRVALVYGLPSSASRRTAADRLVERAKVCYRSADYAGATRLAEEALELDEGNWKAWQIIGNARFARRDRPGAIEAWKKSLAIHPRNTRLREYVTKVERKDAARPKE
ncbi:MAG: hypothetical protein L0215_13440, partial [Gemmataceae bacterium]|nr:hypothetical protein [Gemmataceae bacterium]